MIRHFVRAGSLALVGACAAVPTQPSAQLGVLTDRAAYSDTGTVVVTVQLLSGRAVALNGCPRPPALTIQKASAGRWEDTGSLGLQCTAVETPTTISLGPGGVAKVSLALPGLAAGTYRVAVPVGADAALPDFTVASNTFEVH